MISMTEMDLLDKQDIANFEFEIALDLISYFAKSPWIQYQDDMAVSRVKERLSSDGLTSTTGISTLTRPL